MRGKSRLLEIRAWIYGVLNLLELRGGWLVVCVCVRFWGGIGGDGGYVVGFARVEYGLVGV